MLLVLNYFKVDYYFEGMKEKSEFTKQVESEAIQRADGYFGTDKFESKIAFSFFCDGAEWQRNRVWHTFDEKPDLSKSVLLYDIERNWLSLPLPHTTCSDEFFEFIVLAMNKRYDANYTMWAYMDDITPVIL